MFKSLLRTLPSLSGNFTVACRLNDFVKDDSDSYHTYVKVADLMPLQNNIYKDKIELNLLNGIYEHDVKKYFLRYQNYFYKENFNYSKSNYRLLNLDSSYNETNDNRNKDYEFGCKRIYYSRTGYQFSFYAPFYLDDINDLPEYFCIHINIDNNISKYIKIYINKDNRINYLKRYLTTYYEQVDNRVIYCLPESLQATYFGLDIKKGGLVQYKDNMIGYLYTNQTMINSFDKIICKGFERNNLIMRQIFPISFTFNINDLFNEYERNFFMGHKMQILGHYYSENDRVLDTFDFDMDYFSSYNKYMNYNERLGRYEYSYGEDSKGAINVMNVGYPALNESKYTKYEFENKISPNYCKFKMLLSSDDDPYITNVNFGYSYLQYPNQKYGYFPSSLKGITSNLICIDGDVKLPLGKNIDNYYNTSKYFANTVITNNINYNKFIKLMQNYISSWFTIYNNESLDSLCENNNIWADVTYDYAYFNGIIYNLLKLNKYNIDKFGVFLKTNMNMVSIDRMVKAKYIYSYSDKSILTSYKFNDNYNMKLYDPLLNLTYYNRLFTNNIINSTESNQSYLHYNKVLKKDMYGKYIKDENYKNENIYFKLNDVITIINKINFSEQVKKKILDNININKILGYIVLEGVNNINYFETYRDIYGETRKRFILTDTLFATSNKNAKYEWLYDRLYYSTHSSTKKNRLSFGYNKLEYNEDVGGKFIVYLEEHFVYLYDLYSIIIETYNDVDLINTINEENKESLFVNCVSLLNDLDKFAFESYGKINDIAIENYFINFKDIEQTKSIYVDSYNLNELIKLFNRDYNKNIELDEAYKKEFFIKILNKDHIKEYYFNLNKDENKISPFEFDNSNNYIYKNILECLYVKERTWFINHNTMKAVDTYTTLYNYILKYLVEYKEQNGEIDDVTTYTMSVIHSLINKSNNIIYEWIYSNLSDTRNINNKFELTIESLKIEVDLCFKKNVYLLNEDLFNLLYYDNKINNYLYLYINNNCCNENKDMWRIVNSAYISDYNEKSNERYKWEPKRIDKTLYTKEIDDYLIPLYTDIYINDNNINTLFNMIQHNKIYNYEYIVNNESYFREINTYDMLYDIYRDKSNIIHDLFASIKDEDPLKPSNKSVIDDKLSWLLDNHLEKLNNTLLFYIKNFSSPEYSSISFKKRLSEYMSGNNNDKYVDEKEKIIKAIKYVIENNEKQISLEQYISDNKLLDEFNNEYAINYIIDNGLIDLNNANDKVNAQLSFIKNKSDELYFTLIKNNGITLYSIEDDLNISLSKNYFGKNVIYDESNNIYIYEHNGLKYAFYFIDITIDNSNFSFNVADDYNLNIVFNSINGHDISSDSLIVNKLFKTLYPFLKINIFEEFIKLIDTIVFQNELEIVIKYTEGDYVNAKDQLKYKNYITSENDRLYNALIELSKYKKIKMLRYFNYITPYLKKIDNTISNNWSLKFMEFNNEYNDIEKNNILDISDINIYKYKPLTVYYKEYKEYDDINNFFYEFTDSYEISQYEYKHFNDNLIYNLPEEIILYDDEIFNKNTISIIENDKEYLLNRKIDILYKFFYKKGLDYTNIKLFLFNKYNSSFFIEKNNNKYKVKYIFNLI